MEAWTQSPFVSPESVSEDTVTPGEGSGVRGCAANRSRAGECAGRSPQCHRSAADGDAQNWRRPAFVRVPVSPASWILPAEELRESDASVHSLQRELMKLIVARLKSGRCCLPWKV